MERKVLTTEVSERAKALRWYTIGETARVVHKNGVHASTLAALSGVTELELQEAMDVASRYANVQEFTLSYDSTMESLVASRRNWRGYLVNHGLAKVSEQDEHVLLDTFRGTVRSLQFLFDHEPDPTVALKKYGQMRAWFNARIPTSVLDTNEEEWMRFARCVYCESDEQECVVIRDHTGLYMPMCDNCQRKSADTVHPDFARVAMNYRMYAQELAHANDMLRE